MLLPEPDISKKRQVNQNDDNNLLESEKKYEARDNNQK